MAPPPPLPLRRPPSFLPSLPPCAAPCSGWRSRRGSRSRAEVVGFRRWRPWGILTCSAPASRPPRWSSPCPAGTAAAEGRPAPLALGASQGADGRAGWCAGAGGGALAPGSSAERGGEGAAVGRGVALRFASRPRRASVARGSCGSPTAGRARSGGCWSAAAHGRAAGGARGKGGHPGGGSRSGCGSLSALPKRAVDAAAAPNPPRASPGGRGAGVAPLCAERGFLQREWNFWGCPEWRGWGRGEVPSGAILR